MTKAEKTALIQELTEKFAGSKFFYLTHFGNLSVAQTNNLRRKCFENNIEMRVIKNSLIRKALENVSETGYTSLFDHLKGHTAVLFAEDGKTPAVMLKEYRKSSELPTLKAAYIDQDVVAGDDQIEFLSKLKSKEDLLGELIGLLQSPMSNLLSALNSGGGTIHGLLKALEERGEQ